jgi:hypothetical protein
MRYKIEDIGESGHFAFDDLGQRRSKKSPSSSRVVRDAPSNFGETELGIDAIK